MPHETARMPLYLPTGPLTPEQLDILLAAGFRRSGWFFYRTQCPNCSACEPLRLDPAQFKLTRSQNRVKKRGDRALVTRIANPVVDERRVELFNRHRIQRQLNHNDGAVGQEDYRSFLVNSYGQVVELSLWLGEVLVAVSITDAGARSLSAVYCYFDPEYSHFSPGTYAILQQLQMARAHGYDWHYLGMFVAENRHWRYKANYLPHQRFIRREWQGFSE